MIRAFSLGMVAGSFMTAGVVLLASPAKADGYLDGDEAAYAVTYGVGAICPVIDQYRRAGVLGVAEGIMHDGFAPDSAVDIINAAVSEFCPRHWPLLQAIGRAARTTA